MLTSVRGRSAVVTGATKGIGRGIALALARNGARILVTGRDEAAGERCAQELLDAGAEAVIFMRADAASSDDSRAVAHAAEAAFDGIDILVANAGIYPEASLDELTEADLRAMIDTNLTGTVVIAQACIPALRKSSHGRIVVISSITGPVVGMARNAHYAASKAGQVGFVRSAALELAGDMITVNAVLPGNIETEGLGVLGEEYRESMLKSIPQGRLGTVDDVAGTVLFLVSDEASFITGQTIIVDGGQVLPEARG